MQFQLEGQIDNVFAPMPSERYPEEKVFITIRTPERGDFNFVTIPERVNLVQLRSLRASGQKVKIAGVARGRIFDKKLTLELMELKIAA